jgi:hypothetical protein
VPASGLKFFFFLIALDSPLADFSARTAELGALACMRTMTRSTGQNERTNQQWKSRDESRTKEVKATKGQLDKLYPLRRRRSPGLQIDGLN